MNISKIRTRSKCLPLAIVMAIGFSVVNSSVYGDVESENISNRIQNNQVKSKNAKEKRGDFIESTRKPDGNNQIMQASDEMPRIDGKDVLVPHSSMEKIQDFDENKPVYAACDDNGWLVSGKGKATTNELKKTTMIREGNFWRASGMACQRFHPVQIKTQNKAEIFVGNNINWLRIEKVYDNFPERPFIDMSEGSPCYKVCR